MCWKQEPQQTFTVAGSEPAGPCPAGFVVLDLFYDSASMIAEAEAFPASTQSASGGHPAPKTLRNGGGAVIQAANFPFWWL
jgi:hypothetical protein